jgi:hypothetical protein
LPSASTPCARYGGLIFPFHQRRVGVLDVLGGAQHGEPVRGERFGFLAFGLIHLGIDAAEVEQAPAQPQRAAAWLAPLD